MPMILAVDALWISPYAFSAFVALTEKALPFTVREIALQNKEQAHGDFSQRCATGKIPTLIDGDFWLPESSAIAEYLEERFPPPGHARLLPASLHDRARARMVMAFIRADLLALRSERPTSTMFAGVSAAPLSSAGEEAQKRLIKFADDLIPASATQLFSTWSLADADLTFMLQRLGLNGHELPPKIAAYVKNQWARPSVQAFVTHQRPPYQAY